MTLAEGFFMWICNNPYLKYEKFSMDGGGGG